MTGSYGKRLTTILLLVSLLFSSSGISIAASAVGSVGADAAGSDIGGDVSSDTSSTDIYTDVEIDVEGGALSSHLKDVVVEGGGINVDSDRSGGGFGGGDGSVSAPYLIEDADDLMAMQSIINSGADANKYFKLANDINLSSLNVSDFSSKNGFNSLVSLTPSLSDPNVFFELDGGGYQIKGLDISVGASDNIDAIGIFGYINASSKIKNITFSDCKISIGNKSVAAVSIVAVQNFGTVTDCVFSDLTVDLTAMFSDNTNTPFTSESVNLSSHTVYSGVSAVAADNKGTIKSSQASGIMIKLFSDRRYAGAVAGQNRHNISDITVNDVVVHSYGSNETSSSTSSFTEIPLGGGSESKYVGGIAGFNRAASGASSPVPSISGCVINITGSSTTNFASGDYVGGICGFNAGSVADSIVIGSVANSEQDTSQTMFDMTGCGRFGGISGANTGSVETSTAYNIGMKFTNETADSAFGGITGENAGDISGCVSSGYADDDGNDGIGAGGIAGSVTTGSSLTNCYTFVKVMGFTDNGGAVIGKNGTVDAVSTCRWSSVASGTNYPCPGEGIGYNDLSRFVNVLNISDDASVTVAKSLMLHSWSGSGAAAVDMNMSANNAAITGAGISLSDTGSSFTVSSSTVGASGSISYTVNISFPPGVGASAASMSLVLVLPVLVTDTTETNMSASPKIFAGASREHPITISSYGEFKFLSSAPDAHFKLGGDITIGSGWKAFDFSGTLDGDGHKVTVLSVGLFSSVTGLRDSKISVSGWETDDGNLAGGYIHDLEIETSSTVTGSMFSKVSNATLTDITYGGSGSVTLSSSADGALVSEIFGNCYMNKCYISVPVNITAEAGSSGIAAFVGKVSADNFIIDNCGSSSVVTLSKNLGGSAGLIGSVSALGGKGAISNCYATGKVRVSGSSASLPKVAVGTIATAVHSNPNFTVTNNIYCDSVSEASDSGYSIAAGSSNYTDGMSLWKFDQTYYEISVNGGSKGILIEMPLDIEAFTALSSDDFVISSADSGILTFSDKSVDDDVLSFVATTITSSNFTTVMTVLHSPSGLKASVTVRSGLSENSTGYLEIYTPQDLVSFSAGYGTTYAYTSKVMLCNDINMDDGVTNHNNSMTRLAITANTAFRGEFIGKPGSNGEKFAIKNLRVENTIATAQILNNATSQSACGFFGYAADAVFKNFAMIDCTVDNTCNGTAILVGCTDDLSATGCVFENIDIIGGYAKSSYTGTGGTAAVTAGFVGSLIGAIRSTATSGNPYTIKNIYVKDVTVGFSNAAHTLRNVSVGGLIGGCAAMTADLTIGEDVSVDEVSEPSIIIDNVSLSGYQYVGGVIGSVLRALATPLTNVTAVAVNLTHQGARVIINGVDVRKTAKVSSLPSTPENDKVTIEGTFAGGNGGILGISSGNGETSEIKNCNVDSADIISIGTTFTAAAACAGGIAGFFAGNISSCTVKDSDITGLIAGGIVARASRTFAAQQVTVKDCNVLGETTIQRCSPTGLSSTANQNSKVGGIVAAAAGTEVKIENCGVGKGVSVALAHHSGGIIGDTIFNSDNTRLYVKDSVSYATVENNFANPLNEASAGGIIGYVNAEANRLAVVSGSPIIENCFAGGEVNNTNVSSTSQYAGGILGYYSYSTVNTSSGNVLISNCVSAAQINNNLSYSPSYGGKIIGHVSSTAVLMGTSAAYTVSGVAVSSYFLPDDHSTDNSQSKAAYGDSAVESDTGAISTYADINKPNGQSIYPSAPVIIDATPVGGVVKTTATITVSNLPGSSYIGYNENARLVFNTDSMMTPYGKMVSGWCSLDNDAIEITSATAGTSSTSAVVNITGYENTDSGIFGKYEAQGLYIPGTDELASLHVCIEIKCVNFLDFNLSGSGTQTDPFIIMTKKDLDSLRYADETSGSYDMYYYELGADIVFSADDFVVGGSFYNSGKLFEPIGFNAGTPLSMTTFCGSFSGKRTSTGVQHYISGLKINSAGTHSALFARADGAVFTDLQFTDTAVTSTGNAESLTNYYTAALVGYAVDTQFSNISFDGTNITAVAFTTYVNGYAGTVAAYAVDSSVEDCVITDSKINSASYIGGVFGHAHRSASGTQNTISDTVITGFNAASSDIGVSSILDIAAGVAGEFSGDISNVTVNGTGVINGSRASGVVGMLDETGLNRLTISDTAVNGSISIVSDSIKSNVAAAGIVAKIKNSQLINPTTEALLIERCTVGNKVSISAQYFAGGIVGNCQSLSGASPNASIEIKDSSSFATVVAEDSQNGTSAYMQGVASAVISYIYTGNVLKITNVIAGGAVRAAKHSAGIIGAIDGGTIQNYSETLISNCVISAKIRYTANSRQPEGCSLGLAIASVTTSVLPLGVSYVKAPFANLYYSSYQNSSVSLTGDNAINSSSAPNFGATLCNLQEKVFYFDSTGQPSDITLSSDPLALSSANMKVEALNGSQIGAGEDFTEFNAPTNVSFELSGIASRDESGSSSNLFSYNLLTNVMTPGDIGSGYAVLMYRNGIEIGVGISVSSGGGSGTADDPYTIKNIPDLEMIRINEEGNRSCYYILEADLDFTGYNSGDPSQIYELIPQFTGHLNGSNHAIINLNISNYSTTETGFFGTVTSGAGIENLAFESCSVTGVGNVGTVAGLSSGAIKNVTVSASDVSDTFFYVPDGGYSLGDVVCYYASSDDYSFYSCKQAYVFDAANAQDYLPNAASSSYWTKISNWSPEKSFSAGEYCWYSDTIYVASSAIAANATFQSSLWSAVTVAATVSNVGGIAGSSSYAISDCEVNGQGGGGSSVKGGRNVGGIVGKATAGISGCIVLDGTLIKASDSFEGNAGGIVGRSDTGASDCHVESASIFSENLAGGIVGYTEASSKNMVFSSCFVGGDETSVSVEAVGHAAGIAAKARGSSVQQSYELHITDCIVYSDVDIKSLRSSAAGILSYLNQYLRVVGITGCESYASVQATQTADTVSEKNAAAGILAYTDNNNVNVRYINIQNCVGGGSLQAYFYIGGIVGYFQSAPEQESNKKGDAARRAPGNADPRLVSDCIVSASVHTWSGLNEGVGILVGYITTSIVTDSPATPFIYAFNNNYYTSYVTTLKNDGVDIKPLGQNLTENQYIGLVVYDVAKNVQNGSFTVNNNQWLTGEGYDVGEVVLNEGKYYVCVNPHTSSGAQFNPSSSDWKEAAAWISGQSYASGDICLYGDTIYSALSGYTAPEPPSDDNSDWDIVTVVKNDYLWIPQNKYIAGDITYFNGGFYICAAAHTSGVYFADDTANWTAVSEWEPSASYSEGGYCSYGFAVYSAQAAHTSSASFAADADKWKIETEVLFGYSHTALVLPYSGTSSDNSFKRPVSVVFTSAVGTDDMALTSAPDITVYTDGASHVRTIKINDIYATNSDHYSDSLIEVGGRKTSVLTAVENDHVSPECDLIVDLGHGLIVGIPVSALKTGMVSNGKFETPYLINNEDDFVKYFFGELAKGAYLSNYYKQAADLDFAVILSGISDLGKSFKPIGATENAMFTGGYDGGGYTIRGFEYNGGTSDYCGLFGYVSDSSLGKDDSMLKNIHIELGEGGVSGGKNVGGLAGYYSSRCVITNCSVVFSSASGSDRVGGLVGYMKDGALAGCFTSCDVRTSDHTTESGSLKSAGGLIGFYDYSTTDGVILIKESFSSSDVIAYYYASGFVGKVAYSDIYSHGNIYLVDCYFTGSVCAHYLFNNVSGADHPVSILVGHPEVYKQSISKAASVDNEYVLAQDVYVAGTNVTQYVSNISNDKYYPVLFGTSQEISFGILDGVEYESRNVYYDATVLGTISVDTASNTTGKPDIIIADTGEFTDNYRGDTSNDAKGSMEETAIEYAKTSDLVSTDAKFGSSVWDYSDTGSYPSLEMLDSYSNAFSRISAMPLFIDEREARDVSDVSYCGIQYSTSVADVVLNSDSTESSVSVSSSVYSQGSDTVPYSDKYDINLYGNGSGGSAVKSTDLLFRDKSDEERIMILRNCCFTSDKGKSRNIQTPYVTLSATVNGFAVSRNIRLTFKALINSYYISTERQLRAIMNAKLPYGQPYSENDNNSSAVAKFEVFHYDDGTTHSATAGSSNIYLCSDIELNGSEAFNPISGFEGNFNGMDCVVSNLYINKPGVNNIGFFTSLSTNQKKINSIVLENVKVIGENNVGAFIGNLDGAVYINDCVVSTNRIEAFEHENPDGTPKGAGSFTDNNVYIPVSECIVSGNQNVGGLIGMMTQGTIGDWADISKNNSEQASGADVGVMGQRCVGGFVGAITPNTANDTTSITNCFAKGNVSSASKVQVNTNAPNYYSYGGFAGSAKGIAGNTTSLINYAFATGKVEIDFDTITNTTYTYKIGVGGFCGVTEVNLQNCFSSGAVSVSAGNISSFSGQTLRLGVGGLAGYSSAVISNSYSGSSVGFDYGSDLFDATGFSIVGIGGVCGISSENVTKVYSSGNIVMSHIGASAFKFMFYGGSVGYIGSSANVSKTYYDTWTNNIADLTALGGNSSDNNMRDGGVADLPDNVCSYTTDQFSDGTVIGSSKLPSADWGINNNSYPYLKAMFDSDVSSYIRYPSVLSVIAIRPNERDTTARMENRGYSMALTMPDSIVIEDTNGNIVEYSISWNVPETKGAVGVISSGGNIYAPVRTSNVAQYLSLIAWITGYEENEDYNGDGVTKYDNDGETDGYRKYAERDVDKLYQRMDGTADYPYLISSVLDLEYINFTTGSGWDSSSTNNFRGQWFSPLIGGVNGGVNTEGKVYFKLITNIDMTQDVHIDAAGNTVIGAHGSNATPYVVNAINSMAGNTYYPDLGNMGNSISFKGISIDGNDYIIKNYDSTAPFISTLDSTSELKDILFMDVKIKNSGTGDCALIGENNGLIDGLIVYNNGAAERVISASDGNAAAIAAVNNSTIKNCVAKIDVAAAGMDSYVGGIAAVNNGTILQSTSAGSVTAGAGTLAAGGIAGKNNYEKSITASFSSGSVSGVSSSFVGGLVGRNEGYIATANSRAAVSGYYDTLNSVNTTGSLVGFNSGTISDTFAAGFTTIRDIPTTAQGSALAGVNTGEITNSFADKSLLGSPTYMLLGDTIMTEILFDTAFDGFTSSANGAYPQITDIINILEVEEFDPEEFGGYEPLKYQLLKAYSTLGTVTVDSEYAQYIDTLTAGASNTVTALDTDIYSITAGLADVNGGVLQTGTGTVTSTIKEVTVYGVQVSPIRTKVTAGETNVADETSFYPTLSFDFACGVQNPNFQGGDGSELNPYKIGSAESFESLAYYGAAPEASFAMINDISFDGSEPHEAITHFAGSLDGGAHTISDIEIKNNNALIGEVTGKIKDLGLVGITLETDAADGANYGLLASKAVGAEISGTYAVGNLIINESETAVSSNVGGLIGYMNTSQVKNCVSSGKIINNCTGAGSTVGGIAGLVSGAKAIGESMFSIKDSISTSYVYGFAAVGGIVGKAGSSALIDNVIFAGTAADNGLLSTTVSGGVTVPSKTPTANVSNILGVNDSCTVTNAYFDRQTALLDSEITYEGKSTFDIIRLVGMSGAFTPSNGWVSDSGTVKKYYPSPIAKTGSVKFITGLNFATVRVSVSLAGNEGSVYCYDNINVPTPVNTVNDVVYLTENRTGFSDGNFYLSPTGASDSKAPGAHISDFTAIDINLDTGTGTSFAGSKNDIQRYMPTWIVKSILVEYEIVSAAGSGFGASEKLVLLVSPTTDGFGVTANAQTSVNQSTGAVQTVFRKMVLVDDGGTEGVYISSVLPKGYEIGGIVWHPDASIGETQNAAKIGGRYFADLSGKSVESVHMTVTIKKSPVKWGVNRVWNSITDALD